MSTRARPTADGRGLAALLCVQLLAGCATSSAVTPPTARGVWYELRTPRFVLATDGDRAQAHALIGDLERFRQIALSIIGGEDVEAAPPLRILLTKDRASIVALTHAAPAVHGWFSASIWGNHAIVDGSRLQSDQQSMGGRALLLHGYAHALLAARATPLPSWYIEGLAEYLSTSDFRAGGYTLGCPPAYRSAWTQRGAWLPLDRVLAAANLDTTAAPDVLREGYAESWYLVHYLSAAAERKPQLSRYLALSAAGAAPADAAQQAFGMSSAQLDQALQVYARDPALGCLVVEHDVELAVPEIDQRTLTASEAHQRVGELLLASLGPTAAALDELARAEQIERDSPLTSLALARAHWLRAERGQGDASAELQRALRYLERARASGADSAETLALEGHVQRVISERAWAARTPYSEALVAARKAYRSAIREDETCAEAYVGLGKTYLIEDNGSDEPRAALEAAAYLLPLDTEIALALARIDIARKNALQAVAELEYVLRWSNDERTRADAQKTLDELRALATDARANDPASAAAARPAPATDAPTSGNATAP